MSTVSRTHQNQSMSDASRPPTKGNQSASDGDAKATEIAIRLEDFSSWYGDFQALHSISLEIPRNQVTSFIGPSGCGKSTLLRWFNRMNDTILSAHASGTLVMGDTNLLSSKTDVVDLRRRVGIVFQKPNPFPKSIRANVVWGPDRARWW